MTKPILPEWQEFSKARAEIKPIPGFDPQKWLRKVRKQIYEEIKDMTSEQRCEYFRQAAVKGEQRRVEKKRLAETGGTDS